MDQSKSLDLYYFNLREIKPIIFIITRISSEEDEQLLQDNKLFFSLLFFYTFVMDLKNNNSKCFL